MLRQRREGRLHLSMEHQGAGLPLGLAREGRAGETPLGHLGHLGQGWAQPQPGELRGPALHSLRMSTMW